MPCAMVLTIFPPLTTTPAKPSSADSKKKGWKACASNCANYVQSSSAFRGALFGDLGKNMACVANTIDIDWYNGNTKVESNQCTYDSTITLPTQPNKTGYTFNGWKIKASGNN